MVSGTTSEKRKRPQPYWGRENSGNALEPSNALNCRAWGIPAVLSRKIPGKPLRAFPGSFRNSSGISSGKPQPYWSGLAPANQTKERLVHELFAGAFRNKSSMWIVLVFPRRNTRIHKNGRNSWTLRFGPFFGLVCQGDSWMSKKSRNLLPGWSWGRRPHLRLKMACFPKLASKRSQKMLTPRCAPKLLVFIPKSYTFPPKSPKCCFFLPNGAKTLGPRPV